MGAWVRGRVEGVANYVRMYVCMRGYLRTYAFPARPLLGAQLGANVLDSRKVAGTLELCSVIAAKALSLSLIRLYVFRRPRQCRCHKAACFLDFSEVVNPLSRPRAGVAMAVVVNPGLLILYQLWKYYH